MFALLFAGLASCAVRRPRIAKQQSNTALQAYMETNQNLCDLCLGMVQVFHTAIMEGKTQEETGVEALLFCQLMLSQQEECEELVKNYYVTIYQRLERNETYDEICNTIGYCSTRAKVNSGAACTVCTGLTEYVKDQVIQGIVGPELTNLLNNWCGKLQAPFSTFCQNLANKYVDTIVNWINEGIESLDMCSSIGLCETHVAKNSIPVIAKDNLSCDLCKAVIEYVEMLLVNKKTETQIISLVSQVCQTLPAPLNSVCQSVVEQYIPTILKLIEQGVARLDICNRINMCTEGTDASTLSKFPTFATAAAKLN